MAGTRMRVVTSMMEEDYRETLVKSRVVFQGVVMCGKVTRSKGMSRQCV